jgi:hypothetical protein
MNELREVYGIAIYTIQNSSMTREVFGIATMYTLRYHSQLLAPSVKY